MNKILQTLQEQGPLGSYRLSQLTKIGPASLFPLLMQMENGGQITSEWKDGPRPRTRVYKVKP
jgi:DNA-binding PadR family transcriptional regulator